MNQRNFNRLTASVFAAVAAAHALRLAFRKPIRLGDWDAPQWVSGAAVLAAGYLAMTGAWLADDRGPKRKPARAQRPPEAVADGR